jgi:hypothetical protein
VLAAQGVEATLEAMAAHAGHAAVQAKGALALANVSFVDEGEARVLEAGGVRAVAGALALAPLDVAVAEEVCDCLVNLASSASGRSALDAFAMWGGDGGGGGGGSGGGNDGGCSTPRRPTWQGCRRARSRPWRPSAAHFGTAHTRAPGAYCQRWRPRAKGGSLADCEGRRRC